jgi:hypothetical protein
MRGAADLLRPVQKLSPNKNRPSSIVEMTTKVQKDCLKCRGL